MKKSIKIANDFTDFVGHRFRTDGPKSGQEFREDFLEPLFRDKSISEIEIDMDDSWNYPTSFLEETFGGLVRIFGKREVENKIKLISRQDTSLIRRINNFIEKAAKDSGKL